MRATTWVTQNVLHIAKSGKSLMYSHQKMEIAEEMEFLSGESCQEMCVENDCQIIMSRNLGRRYQIKGKCATCHTSRTIITIRVRPTSILDTQHSLGLKLLLSNVSVTGMLAGGSANVT